MTPPSNTPSWEDPPIPCPHASPRLPPAWPTTPYVPGPAKALRPPPINKTPANVTKPPPPGSGGQDDPAPCAGRAVFTARVTTPGRINRLVPSSSPRLFVRTIEAPCYGTIEENRGPGPAEERAAGPPQPTTRRRRYEPNPGRLHLSAREARSAPTRPRAHPESRAPNALPTKDEKPNIRRAGSSPFLERGGGGRPNRDAMDPNSKAPQKKRPSV